jgi:hypothetical protein
MPWAAGTPASIPYKICTLPPGEEGTYYKIGTLGDGEQTWMTVAKSLHYKEVYSMLCGLGADLLGVSHKRVVLVRGEEVIKKSQWTKAAAHAGGSVIAMHKPYGRITNEDNSCDGRPEMVDGSSSSDFLEEVETSETEDERENANFQLFKQRMSEKKDFEKHVLARSDLAPAGPVNVAADH